jgi:hypothetical protein
MQGSAHDYVANAETTLQQQIRLALGTHPDTRLFRNQVGSFPTHAPAGLSPLAWLAAPLT